MQTRRSCRCRWRLARADPCPREAAERRPFEWAWAPRNRALPAQREFPARNQVPQKCPSSSQDTREALLPPNAGVEARTRVDGAARMDARRSALHEASIDPMSRHRAKCSDIARPIEAIFANSSDRLSSISTPHPPRHAHPAFTNHRRFPPTGEPRHHGAAHPGALRSRRCSQRTHGHPLRAAGKRGPDHCRGDHGDRQQLRVHRRARHP